MKNTNRRLIFLHLPKNAGTTLNAVLKKRYSEEEIFQVGYNENGKWNINEFIELSQKEKDRIEFLTGHFIFGIHEHFSNEFKYVTMLRHPVDRTISFYNYIKRQKTHRLLDAVKNRSLIECVTQIKDFDVVNGQARKLSNCEDENFMLNKALESIERHFEFVGIQEYFEESILLLNNKFKLGITHYNTLNTAGAKPQIDTDLVRAIEKTNQVDMELYNIMKDKFVVEFEKIKNRSAKLGLLRASNKIKVIYDKLK